jgi:hypothetical protein
MFDVLFDHVILERKKQLDNDFPELNITKYNEHNQSLLECFKTKKNEKIGLMIHVKYNVGFD